MEGNDRIWVGVDPGVSGGIAVITHENVCVFDMPRIEREQIDAVGFRRILLDLKPDRDRVTVAIEKVQGFGSYSSAFTLGRASGIVECAFMLFGFEQFEYIHPAVWIRGLGLGGRQSKTRHIDLANSLFPNVCISGDGQADALLIAHFARTRHN